MNDQALAPSSLLCRYCADCLKYPKKWGVKGVKLDETHLLPHFGQLDGQRTFATIKSAWSEQGLLFDVQVNFKQQSLWCRSTQMLESDRVMFWIDTRNTHSVHRATRFCHWFLAMPAGGGSDGKQPLATMLKINRAKEDSPSLNQVKQQVVCKLSATGGYHLQLLIPANGLSGWNPDEHKRIGFNYAVVDRELGWQTLACGPQLPIEEDPSLWQTLELKT